MERIYIGDQGEVAIYRISHAPPENLPLHTEVDAQGRPIISHSEKGHHHVLERPAKVVYDAGMDTLYALLETPMRLLQDAPDAHGEHHLKASWHMFVIGQEFDPFTQQARRIAD